VTGRKLALVKLVWNAPGKEFCFDARPQPDLPPREVMPFQKLCVGAASW
jgi:hypothetical protein